MPRPRRQPDLFQPNDMAPSPVSRAVISRDGSIQCGPGCTKTRGCRACKWLRYRMATVLGVSDNHDVADRFRMAHTSVYWCEDLLHRLKDGALPTTTVEEILRENREIVQTLERWKPIAYRCRLNAWGYKPFTLVVQEHIYDGVWAPDCIHKFSLNFVDRNDQHKSWAVVSRCSAVSGIAVEKTGGSCREFTPADTERYLAELGERFSECDWRPRGTLPEDYYA